MHSVVFIFAVLNKNRYEFVQVAKMVVQKQLKNNQTSVRLFSAHRRYCVFLRVFLFYQHTFCPKTNARRLFSLFTQNRIIKNFSYENRQNVL